MWSTVKNMNGVRKQLQNPVLVGQGTIGSMDSKKERSWLKKLIKSFVEIIELMKVGVRENKNKSC